MLKRSNYLSESSTLYTETIAIRIKNRKENIQVYYIAIHYNVKKENAYQLDGMNYFLQVFVKERGEWKIAESVVAPTEQIVQNGDGFGMKEEMVYGDRENKITSS